MSRGTVLLVSAAGLLVLSVFLGISSIRAGDPVQINQERLPDWNPMPPDSDLAKKLEFELKSPLPRIQSGVVYKAFEMSVEDTIYILLPQGECFKETYVCSIPETPPIADILIDFDLTGSMGDELANLKTNSVKIMTAIRKEIENSNFGLISGEDYGAQYNPEENCDYYASYGSSFYDSPYRLDTELTSDTAAVRSAINSMWLGFGDDCPECYSRRFYEAIAELIGEVNPVYGPIGWRTAAKKIVLSFNDAVPHDCDWTQCSGLPPSGACVAGWTSGRDPGRDELVNTADDIVLMDVLAKMAELNVTLVDIYSGYTSLKPHWDCWTKMTPGGGAFQINSNGTIPGGMSIDSFIVDVIMSTFDTVDIVVPGICAGDETFLVSVEPPSYENVVPPAVVTFELEFCAPNETPPGTYCFDICFEADGGEFERQSYCIEVIEPTTFVDIKPRSCPNPINVKSNGVLPVAILGASWLDVATIDASSVRLIGVAPIRSDIEDVTRPFYKKQGECDCTQEGPDGYPDLTLKFDKQEIVEALGEVEDRAVLELELTSNLVGGEELPIGYDCVVILNNAWRQLRPRGGDEIQTAATGDFGAPRFGLFGARPNPANGPVRIDYALDRDAEMYIAIYDLTGREVKTLRRGALSPGEYAIDWDCTDESGARVRSGTYFCRLKAGELTDTKKIQVAR
jgi:hypothetical protein